MTPKWHFALEASNDMKIRFRTAMFVTITRIIRVTEVVVPACGRGFRMNPT